jgi:hypothetical protein
MPVISTFLCGKSRPISTIFPSHAMVLTFLSYFSAEICQIRNLKINYALIITNYGEEKKQGTVTEVSRKGTMINHQYGL